jgi:hypothetical protein
MDATKAFLDSEMDIYPLSDMGSHNGIGEHQARRAGQGTWVHPQVAINQKALDVESIDIEAAIRNKEVRRVASVISRMGLGIRLISDSALRIAKETLTTHL